MTTTAESATHGVGASASELVLRNTLLLSMAQLLSLPLSILLNASMARYLGATALGYLYLGGSFNGFGFLLVDWGQSGALPALIATDRARAGSLLGSSLVWRIASALVVGAAIYGVCTALGYSDEVRLAIALFSVAYLATSIVNACQETTLGFERTDVGAMRQLIEGIAAVALVVPIMMLGGKLPLALVGCAGSTVVAFVFVWRALARVGVGPIGFERAALRQLLRRGTPFAVLNLALLLQPNLDAAFLAKFASADAVGWHAAARKLVGLLLFPATTLIGALYPTLCRLFTSDRAAFVETTASALRGTALMVIPVSLGCALYPDLGLAIYGRSAFAPAQDNLRILSVFVGLLYFTLPLGCCLLAAGKQRAWAIAQAACVVVSAALDPVLVPWFQRRAGNGGLGIAVAAVVSELIVITCGIALAPRGLFGRRFWASMLPALASGLAMVVVARALRDANPFLAAPIAVAAYVVALRLCGGLDDATLELLFGFARNQVARRLSRKRG